MAVTFWSSKISPDDLYGLPINYSYTLTNNGHSQCGNKLKFRSVAGNSFVIVMLLISLIITAVWLIASLIGIGCGAAGACAEKSTSTVAPSAVVVHSTLVEPVVTIQVSAEHGNTIKM